jgi:hypothetical protein
MWLPGSARGWSGSASSPGRRDSAARGDDHRTPAPPEDLRQLRRGDRRGAPTRRPSERLRPSPPGPDGHAGRGVPPEPERDVSAAFGGLRRLDVGGLGQRDRAPHVACARAGLRGGSPGAPDERADARGRDSVEETRDPPLALDRGRRGCHRPPDRPSAQSRSPHAPAGDGLRRHPSDGPPGVLRQDPGQEATAVLGAPRARLPVGLRRALGKGGPSARSVWTSRRR